MAKNIIYLRPSADISVGHTLVPAESTNAYSLINEEVSDGTATYIVSTAPVATDENTPSTATATSSFELSVSGNLPTERFRVSSAKISFNPIVSITGDHTVSTCFTIIVNGVSFTIDGVLPMLGGTNIPLSDEAIDVINNYIAANGVDSFPYISITCTTTATNNSTKYTCECGITQLFLELTCNILVYRKVNNKWKDAFAAYKKIDGVWSEIENGYETIGSRLSKSGHHQEFLPAVFPTCTESGLTKGYKCVVCGKNIRPQEVIPANGHNYIKSGGYNVCTVCDYVEGLGFVELVYHGNPTALSEARRDLAATTIGKYALFGGGNVGNSSYYVTIDVYDTSLTRTTPTTLSQARYDLAATTVGNYALFGGGTGSSTFYDTVDVYDTSLTRTTPTTLSQARYDLAATTVGNYALFGGGYCADSGYSATDTVDALDTSLTRTTPTTLSQARCYLAATTVGNYALFGGGGSGRGGYYSTVDAFDASLTRTIPTALNRKKEGLAATTVGNFALFGGGYVDTSGEAQYGDVEAYNKSLTKNTTSSPTDNGGRYAATTVGNYALFGGGFGYGNEVSAYDMSLTATEQIRLSEGGERLAAAAVGNYALFGGGWYSTGDKYRSTVDAYKLQPISG